MEFRDMGKDPTNMVGSTCLCEVCSVRLMVNRSPDQRHPSRPNVPPRSLLQRALLGFGR